MRFEKAYKIGGKWYHRSLKKEEITKLTKKVREINFEIMRECLDDAMEIVKEKIKGKINIGIVFDTGKALFNKRGLALYTAIEAELNEKIQLEREKWKKERDKLFEEKIESDKKVVLK